VVVVDMFDTDASEIAAFKADGHTVVCYYSAGTFEDWRDDYTTNKVSGVSSPPTTFPGVFVMTAPLTR
jgi:hypothetical protein